ncbi:MAG: amino acid adenylation domain-containing protein, partial [Pseudomonadales bacterium]|nr:amino acid adenylation domain-containing protein [Pseudomonadales bacterium]
TSGSTGQPKGAMVTHSGEANLQNWYIESLGLTEADRTLLVSAVGFDLSQKNLFAPLLVGAAIVMPRMELFDEQELLELIHTHSVTWVNCAPSAFYPLVETSAANGFKQLQSLRFLVLGGEPIRLSTLYPWLTCTNTKVQLINSYGPTECTDVVAYHKVQLVENENQIIPIGKPINNTQLHVLNDNLQQVVPGCVGEICITGAGVGLGYIGRDELTASVFLDSPFGEGKLYKTGDLGRFRSDGTVEYVGRKDFQIKLRGLRIELGEIEHALKQLTGVQDGLVLVEEEKLIAFVVTSDGQVVEDWRAQLREYLPEYMIPSVAVGVERWPLTPNGKIDRKALPSASSVIQQANVYVAPRTEMETQVAAIWEQVLQKQNIGVLDNLFEIGGNSLLATRIVSRVKKQFDVAVSVRDLFLAPTVSDFASVIGRSKQIGQLPEIEVSDYSQPLPVSYAQQRLWFLHQLDANNTAYNMPGAFRVSGKLNEDAFEQAVGEIVARHGVLRSRIIEHEDVPVQQIDAEGSGFFKLVDLSALSDERQVLAIDQHVDSLYRHVFDFANGPLFYVSLLRLAEDEHILLVNMHHIVSDGWSNGILMRELGVLYDAFEHGRSSPLPELKIQYADFSKWQRNWLSGDELERQVSYWRENLTGVEILNLPTSYPRTVNTGFAGNVLSFDIDGQLTAKLKRLSQHSGASLYMTTLAAYIVLLSKYSHQDDISVGSPIANRNHEDIEPLIGFFVNTLVMRASVDPSASFESLLKQIQTNTLQAYSHQDVPFEKLVDELVTERDMLHAPLFQVLFSLQNVPVDTDFTLPGLKLSGISNHNVVSKFDLEFSLMEQGGIIKAEVVYRTELFSKRYVERLIDHYLMLLNAVTEDATQPINQLTMLTQQDVAKLHSWNLTETPYDKTATIHQLFEAQAQQSPNAKALICGSNSLTYAELNDRANQFAHMLQAHNVSSGDTVGIMLPRSMGLMIAVMGALKAGASYLPLDPSYPKDRLAYMLADSGAVCVVGNEPMDGVTQSFIQFDDSQSQLASYPTDAVSVSVTSDSLLYVIYTSGSTGRPKGTGAKHRAEVNLLNWYCREFSMGPSDRVLLVSAIGFDLTQKNLFAPLVSGAALVIPEIHEYDPMHLLECIQKHHVSWINCAPNAFYPLVEESTPNDLQSLRYVFLGGEPIDFDRLKNWLQNASAKLVNSYGPTECADIATYHVVDDVDAYNSSSIPIGKAIDNVKLYVLDELQRMVPEGVPGELCIGGDGVGPGYFNDQAQTEEKFIANPFSQTEDTLYRTGDLVRYLADGEIEYLGRIDSQVKIRGFRIEPGEIENHLRQIPAVNASCVIALSNQQGVKELVAYLVCDEDSLDIEHVRQQLKAKLPDFMVPPFFVVLDALPLTPNGKVAKNLLPAPDRAQVVERDIIKPANDIEQHILSVWQSVLGVEEISTADDFFTVGGHSLLATQVVSRIRKHYRVNLALRSLFEAPTIQNIAQQVELALGQQQQALPPITTVDRSGALPLSFVQQQLWLLDQLDPGT